MSCVSQTYNCKLTWHVEHFSVFWYQSGSTFCVPEADVEIFNSKWRMSLRKQTGSFAFVLRRLPNAVSENREQEIVFDLKVSLFRTDGKSHDSVIKNGIKLGEGLSEASMCFELHHMEHDDIFPKFPKDALSFLIEIRFCDSTPLILTGTVRTKMRTERLKFTWPLNDLESVKPSENLSIPIDVHLEKSPNFRLMLSNTHSQEAPISVGLQKCTSGSSQIAGGHQETCDILVLASVLGVNRAIFCRLFFQSRSTNDIQKIPFEQDYWSFSFPKVLFCEFLFSDGKSGTILEQIDYTYPSLKAESPAATSSYLGQSLYKEQKFTDVTLKARNKTFKAHKVVLSAVSPVFNSMFDHEMKEQATGVVCIEDVEPDTLERMLGFMYTSYLKADAGFEETSKLFEAADKYQIHSLKSHCSDRLKSLMVPENVCRVLHLAYMHDDDDLQKAAKELFSKNPSEVLDSKAWKTFMENCIRGRSAKKSFVSDLVNPVGLRRSFSQIGQRIRRSTILKSISSSSR